MAKHPNLRCAEMLELEWNGHCSICFKNAYILKDLYTTGLWQYRPGGELNK